MALGITSEAPRRDGCGYVPEEDGTVAAGGDEALVVGCDSEAEDFVAVGGVGLDEPALGDGGLFFGFEGGDGGAGEGVVETDGAVC